MADDVSKFGMSVDLDTTGATKNLENLEKQAKKTNTAINGLNEANTTLKNVDKNIENIDKKFESAFSVGKLLAIAGGITAIAYAAKKLYDGVSNSAGEMVSLGNAATGLFMDTNKLKAWQTTFKEFNIDAKTTASTFGALQNQLTAQIRNPTAEFRGIMSQIGLNPDDKKYQHVDNLVVDLSKQLKKFSPEQAASVGQQFGLSGDITQILKNNDIAALYAKNAANPVTTKEEEDQAKKLIAEQAKLSAAIDKLTNEALLPLIPLLTTLVQHLTGLFNTPTKDIPGKILQKSGLIPQRGSGFVQNIKDTFGVPGESNSAKAAANKAAIWVSGKAEGFSDEKIEALMYTANLEARFNKNAKNNASSAKGVFQIIDKTMRDAGGGDPYNIGDSTRVAGKLYDEFAVYMKSKGLKANAENYREYHHLGDKAFRYRVDHRNNANLTHGDVYRNSGAYTDPERTAQINQSLVNKTFPPLISASESVARSVDNSRNTTITNEVNIGTQHVNSNNPQEFANSMAKYMDYNDRFLATTNAGLYG